MIYFRVRINHVVGHFGLVQKAFVLIFQTITFSAFILKYNCGRIRSLVLWIWNIVGCADKDQNYDCVDKKREYKMRAISDMFPYVLGKFHSVFLINGLNPKQRYSAKGPF